MQALDGAITKSTDKVDPTGGRAPGCAVAHVTDANRSQLTSSRSAGRLQPNYLAADGLGGLSPAFCSSEVAHVVTPRMFLVHVCMGGVSNLVRCLRLASTKTRWLQAASEAHTLTQRLAGC